MVPADLAPALVVPADRVPALVVPADLARALVVPADLAPAPAAREGRAERARRRLPLLLLPATCASAYVHNSRSRRARWHALVVSSR